jgi:hypothetical protein
MTTFTLEQKLFAFDAVWMIDRLTTFGDAKTFAFFPLNTGPPKGYIFISSWSILRKPALVKGG